MPLKVGRTRFNARYLETKAAKSGHLLVTRPRRRALGRPVRRPAVSLRGRARRHRRRSAPRATASRRRAAPDRGGAGPGRPAAPAAGGRRADRAGGRLVRRSGRPRLQPAGPRGRTASATRRCAGPTGSTTSSRCSTGTAARRCRGGAARSSCTSGAGRGIRPPAASPSRGPIWRGSSRGGPRGAGWWCADLARLPGAEDRRADADVGGAVGDRRLEVVAHAHREAGEAVAGRAGRAAARSAATGSSSTGGIAIRPKTGRS